jgi:hypothetical protein
MKPADELIERVVWEELEAVRATEALTPEAAEAVARRVYERTGVDLAGPPPANPRKGDKRVDPAVRRFQRVAHIGQRQVMRERFPDYLRRQALRFHAS